MSYLFNSVVAGLNEGHFRDHRRLHFVAHFDLHFAACLGVLRSDVAHCDGFLQARRKGA